MPMQVLPHPSPLPHAGEGTRKPIAILGGTFDPVHLGHLRVAWEAAEALDAEVRLMPAHVPPHRPAPVASAAQRVRMLEAALAGQSRLVLDTRELRRAGASYTFDTLCELRNELPAGRALILLLGADAFAGLPTWHRWRELFEHAHLVVLTRPGHTLALSGQLAAETASRRVTSSAQLCATPAGKLFDLAVTPLEISASAVRALLAAGREPRWLLPDALCADRDLLAPYRA
jgi:nicotinate-nucleotide adenylyltransferase